MDKIMLTKEIEREQQLPAEEIKTDPPEKHIQVIGLDEYTLKLLRTIEYENTYLFHPLINMDELRGVDEMDVERLLEGAIEKLESQPDKRDAIVTFIDFPAIELMAYLTDRYKLGGPILEDVLKCNHKYWSRLIQKRIVPEYIPEFCSFNPYAKDPLEEINLDFPFWIKPLNSYRSLLGFRINNRNDFDEAIAIVREDLPRLARPFNYMLSLADIPGHVEELGGHRCMAESILTGHQCTLEGYSYDGEVEIYGVIDSIRSANRSSFERYQYPSRLPARVQQQMIRISKKVIRETGLQNGAFNIEFFHDEETDQIWLLEINPRISQSHGELFLHVDGCTNHKVMLDLAFGNKPTMPYREGTDKVAAKYFLRSFEDGIVSRVPSEAGLEAIRRAVPGVSVSVLVGEGERLSELQDQDSYSYELAWVWIGGRDEQELKEKYNLCVRLLDFRIEIQKP